MGQGPPSALPDHEATLTVCWSQATTGAKTAGGRGPAKTWRGQGPAGAASNLPHVSCGSVGHPRALWPLAEPRAAWTTEILEHRLGPLGPALSDLPCRPAAVSSGGLVSLLPLGSFGTSLQSQRVFAGKPPCSLF